MKPGDVVLISYSDKSKTGTYRLGIVEKVETDEDGLVRTCLVGYRLVRSDMPAEELKFYYKGMKWKEIRVPIQRLCVILPIEEHGVPDFLKKQEQVLDVDRELVNLILSDDEVVVRRSFEEEVVEVVGPELVKDLDDIGFNDERQRKTRFNLVQSYKLSLVKEHRVQQTNRSVKLLHKKLIWFQMMWTKEESVKK